MHPARLIPEHSPFSAVNLPYGVFRPTGGGPSRAGVRIGDYVLDLAQLEQETVLPLLVAHGEPAVFAQPGLNRFLSLGRPAWTAVRHTLTDLLQTEWQRDSAEAHVLERSLHALNQVQLEMPVAIGDYTDFYSSLEHASNVGTMFRGRENALLPNWRHIPIAYHGRSSSIVLDGTPITRPRGQVYAQEDESPRFQPTAELDFELEVGFLTGPATELGQSVSIDEAANYIFGLVLVNDWSARDIQRWEYRPLGPFLGKNFATSISAWIVPLAALESVRRQGPTQDPAPLPYLQTDTPWAFDIELRATLESANMRAAGIAPATVTRTNFRHLYWNMAQQLAHHTSNGCAIRPGDLLASGTISGPEPDSLGSLLELSWGGTKPLVLPTGETRSFLADGDRLTLSGWARTATERVGLGDVSGTVQPAVE